MKRENILIAEKRTEKRVVATKFTAPGDVPAFDCSIHFGEESDDVTLQNCIIQANALVKCSPDDTYDFETGALIALMKMCGRDKVIKACDELYKDDNYKNALQEVTENLDSLSKKYDLVTAGFDYWKGECAKLHEELKRLKGEKENEWKNYQRNIQKKQDRINELERAYKTSNDDKAKLVEYYQHEIKKLQHGYIDTDMIFCGGRQNGKQYTFLVELFKKIPKEKVQAAYIVAYKESLIWCTSQPSIRDSLTVDSLIEESRAFTRKCVDEWLYGPPTKREEMWENILSASQDPPVDIKVAKQDIKAFLKELQDHIPKARWNGSDCLVTEYTNPYWFNHDYIYFALFRYDDKANLKICYDECKHTWINKPVIEYLPPMRWDLFKKGRLAVKVNYDNYKEFCEACEKELGKKPSTYFWDNVTISICKKDGNFEIFTIEHQKKTGRKIVDWEDVR